MHPPRTLATILALGSLAMAGAPAGFQPSPSPNPALSGNAAARMANRIKQAAIDGRRQGEYLREWIQLRDAMKERHIDISFALNAIKNYSADDALNDRVEVQETVIAAAAYDCNCQADSLFAKYPEFARRASVCGIEDFEKAGTPLLLFRGPEYLDDLHLVLLNPQGVLGNRVNIDVSDQTIDGFKGKDPLQIVHKDGRVFVQVIDQGRPSESHIGSNVRTFYRRVEQLRLVHHKFVAVSDSTKELPAEVWKPLDENTPGN
jgi:hypothetical protein